MTINIEFDIPVYRLDRYEQLERQGRVKISSTIDALKEGDLTKEYERLRKETDILIANINARTRLAAETSEIEDELRWKSQKLKDILDDIEKAKGHLDTLKLLLQNLGVDSNSRLTKLTFDKQLLLTESGAQVQVTQTQKYTDF